MGKSGNVAMGHPDVCRDDIIEELPKPLPHKTIIRCAFPPKGGSGGRVGKQLRTIPRR